MLPAHVSSARRGCLGSPAPPRGLLGSRGGWGHGTGHPPHPPRLHRAAPAAPRGAQAADAEGLRRVVGHSGGATGIPHARGGGDVLAHLRGDAQGATGTPVGPLPSHEPPTPSTARAAGAGQTSRPAAEAGELFPGHAVGRAAGVRSDRKPPSAAFPKPSCEAAPGVGAAAGKGEPSHRSPPAAHRAELAPGTVAGAAISDGPVASGKQSPVPPGSPIPSARLRAQPRRSHGWGQSGTFPTRATRDPDQCHLTLPSAPSRGGFAAQGESPGLGGSGVGDAQGHRGRHLRVPRPMAFNPAVAGEVTPRRRAGASSSPVGPAQRRRGDARAPHVPCTRASAATVVPEH